MFEYSPPLEPWLDILFKDKDIMVVNKPTGLLSVPGRGPENEDSVLHRVKQQHPKAAAAHPTSKSRAANESASNQPTLAPCSRRASPAAFSKWLLPLPLGPHR